MPLLLLLLLLLLDSCHTDELQSWLDLCRQDPLVRSYLEASGGLKQLPKDVSCLQPHQLDALRETVAVAQANRGVAGAKSSGRQADVKEQGGSQDCLDDYTDMNMVSMMFDTRCCFALLVLP